MAVAAFVAERALTAGPPAEGRFSPSVVAAVAGLLVLVGLWTPFAAALIAVLEFWIVASACDARPAHLLAGTIAVCLTMLGPGAHSVDSRLFGRRRISSADR